jgi:hypothetical protein
MNEDGRAFVNTHPIWHNHPMCGRYRLSRRKQILPNTETKCTAPLLDAGRSDLNSPSSL